MTETVSIKVDLRFEMDTTEVSPEYRNNDGITEIIEGVLDAGVYDIPGASLKYIAVDIEGLD